MPHHDLLDKVQLSVIPIIHELPMMQSLLKWVKHMLDGKSQAHPMGWMLLSEDNWSQEAQIEKLSRLCHSVNELGKSLKPLMSNIQDFAKDHRKIERAIYTLHGAYREIPMIEPDIQLLKMGHTLYDNPDLVAHLFDYAEESSTTLTKASHLKQVLFDEIIDGLSIQPPIKEERIS